MNKRRKGISLIVLVITILVMIILAGVVVVSLSKNNPIEKAKEATFKQDMASFRDELSVYIANTISLDDDKKLSSINASSYSDIKKMISSFTRKYVNKIIVANGEVVFVGDKEEERKWAKQTGIYIFNIANTPVLRDGMIPVKFVDGKVVVCSQEDPEWQDLSKNLYANVMLSDGKYKEGVTVGTVVEEADLGSMFVWIPRFAYKVTSGYKGGTGEIDVKFLVGTSNYSLDKVDIVEYTKESTNNYSIFPNGYVVHPAFRDGSKKGFSSGEWDEEANGFWIAKFEAAVPQDVNAPKSKIDNMYYPVYKAKLGSYNYTSVIDSYRLCKAMVDVGNPYGLKTSSPHLVKNSEWGAVAYLSTSKYGKNGIEVFLNNVTYSLAKDISSILAVNGRQVYAVTGFSADTPQSNENKIKKEIHNESVSGSIGTSYAWNTTVGRNASTSGNITGVYDMSGGLVEYTSSYVAAISNTNNKEFLNLFGNEMVYKEVNGKKEYVGSNKFVTMYPEYSPYSIKNVTKDIHGDAITETYNWKQDKANNDTTGPFIIRGDVFNGAEGCGVYAFDDYTGGVNKAAGFRCVIY